MTLPISERHAHVPPDMFERMSDEDDLTYAHHDGSELYAPQDTPRLGETIPLRVRTGASSGIDTVWVRSVRDGEPYYEQARIDREADGERWFVADLDLHNPRTSYRFLLGSGKHHTWLNAAGIRHRDGTDTHDFRISTEDHAPAWVRDAVVYQIFPDRFAPTPGTNGFVGELPDWAIPAAWDDTPVPFGPDTGRQLFGGTLAGIESRLDYIQSLGATTVYLTPFFPGRSNHRYDASTFDHVDPLLGGDAALASLSAAIHARGMRIMGDLTSNHTGAGHDWFTTSQSDANSTEADFFYWNKARDDYIGWLGHKSLPKLNFAGTEVWRRMIDAPDSTVRRWLAHPYSLDGWRIDVANMTGRYGADDFNTDVARAIRSAITEMNPAGALFAEHCHDYSYDLAQNTWDGAMNYSGFLRPVWSWLTREDSDMRFLDAPVTIQSRPGTAAVDWMRDVAASIPWAVSSRNWNLLCTHDTARIRTVVGSAERHIMGATLLFTYPGTPFMLAGDEGSLPAVSGEQARSPMPWHDIENGGGVWDASVNAAYRQLLAVRARHRALRHGGIRWAVATDDAVAYLRESADERMLVLVARRSWPGARIPLGRTVSELVNVFGDMDIRVEGGVAVIPGEGPTSQVWRIA